MEFVRYSPCVAACLVEAYGKIKRVQIGLYRSSVGENQNSVRYLEYSRQKCKKIIKLYISSRLSLVTRKGQYSWRNYFMDADHELKFPFISYYNQSSFFNILKIFYNYSKFYLQSILPFWRSFNFQSNIAWRIYPTNWISCFRNDLSWKSKRKKIIWFIPIPWAGFNFLFEIIFWYDFEYRLLRQNYKKQYVTTLSLNPKLKQL